MHHNKGSCDEKSGDASVSQIMMELHVNVPFAQTDAVMLVVSVSLKSSEQLAVEANRVYSTPWDAEKQIECVCDRGPDCSLYGEFSSLYMSSAVF